MCGWVGICVCVYVLKCVFVHLYYILTFFCIWWTVHVCIFHSWYVSVWCGCVDRSAQERGLGDAPRSGVG